MILGEARGLQFFLVIRGGLTNNQAEYRAFLAALQNVPDSSAVEMYSDSQLICSQFAGNYRVKDYALRNDTRTANHWLILKLTGHKSNRDAIGAEAKVVTARGTQYATVTTAGSYPSSSEKRVPRVDVGGV